MPWQEMTTELIMAKFLWTAQSKRDLQIENNLIISTSIINIATGTSSRMKDFIKKSKGIIKIKNNDNFCALRAMVVGIAHNDYFINSELKYSYDQIIDSPQSKKQQVAAERLAREMKFNEHTIISLVEIKQIEQHLKEYQVLVVSDTNNFDFIYVGARIKKLFFFFHDSHFDYLKSLPAFFDCDKFCFICLLPYHHNLAHKCLKIILGSLTI